MPINYADYPIGRVVSYYSTYYACEVPAHIVGFSMNCIKEVLLVLRVPMVTDNDTVHNTDILMHPSNITLI